MKFKAVKIRKHKVQLRVTKKITEEHDEDSIRSHSSKTEDKLSKVRDMINKRRMQVEKEIIEKTNANYDTGSRLKN